MGVQNYPSSSSLIITFLENVKRYRVNRINGMNPSLINFNGEQIYVYIRNLSPAQLSNDNPDIWRIQLPKREEFEIVKRSDKLFFLFGYDHIRKVYTTWNPYWCKQRLNVAESCSMYSRFSLQKRVADFQKIEVMQLQNEGNVVCIPSSLLGSYITKYKEYYPEESIYIPVGSSIQKRKNEEQKNEAIAQESYEEVLFEKFKSFYNTKEFQDFLQNRGYKESIAKEYVEKLSFIFEKGYLKNHADLFLECNSLKDYIRAINSFVDLPEIRYYEDRWGNTILASLRHYLVFAERKIYGMESIRIPSLPNKDKFIKLKSSILEKSKIIESKKLTPKFELDVFGKLKSLDSIIIEQLLPLVRGIDFPDYNEMIKKVKAYYPPKATEKMTPADWMNLFDSTKWQKKRGRKSTVQHHDDISEETKKDKISKIVEDINIQEVDEKPEYLRATIDINKLKSVFDKRVTSYKYFWFTAILGLAKKNRKRSITFSDILIRMIALAWPIIFEDGINLGEQDMMSNYLKEIQKKSYLIKNASSKVVESSLSDYYRLLSIDKIINPLLNNVPYRFLSPWIKFTNNGDVIDKSKKDSIMAPYALYTDCIVINSEWYDYFMSHYEELCTFTLKSFVEYAKQYNNNLKFVKLLSTGWSRK